MISHTKSTKNYVGHRDGSSLSGQDQGRAAQLLLIRRGLCNYCTQLIIRDTTKTILLGANMEMTAKISALPLRQTGKGPLSNP